MFGLKEEEFWYMTPKYFGACAKAYEQRVQTSWEQARYIGYLCVIPHIKRGRHMKPQDLGRFPWEVHKAKQIKSVPQEVLEKWKNL